MSKFSFFRVLANDLTNENGNEYSRLQCLVSGEVSAVYNTQFSGITPNVGTTLMSSNVTWEKNELGSLVNGLFLEVDAKDATKAILEDKAQSFKNSLTSKEKEERKATQTANSIAKRTGISPMDKAKSMVETLQNLGKDAKFINDQISKMAALSPEEKESLLVA